jgi:pimeloyl-ACP methyl ester carboxylesterase
MKLLSFSANGLLLVCVWNSLAFAEDNFPEERYFDSNGVRIRYIDVGEGVPIILLHGAWSSLEGWNKGDTLQVLSEKFRVIAMDLRGHGKSGKPHGKEHYGIEMGLDALRLLDHLNIPKAHFAGYSRGARIVGQLMVHHPDRFFTATLGGREPMLEWDPAREPSMEKLMARYRDRPPSPDPNAPQQDLVAMASAQLGRESWLVTEDQLRSIGIPVLGIVGSKDTPENIVRLEGIIPLMKVVVIDGATHGGEAGAMLRSEFSKTMVEFLAKHSPRN